MLWDTNFFCLVCALLHTASTSHAWYFLLFCGGQLHVSLMYSHCGLWTSCSTGLSQVLYMYGSKLAPKLKLCVERHVKRTRWGWDVSFVCVTYCWECLTLWKWLFRASFILLYFRNCYYIWLWLCDILGWRGKVHKSEVLLYSGKITSFF